ncbi:MAG: hypothetical protein MUD13_02820 [Candidatus Nanopelagicales bacterium]|nr:hypothetical protein [Candidatus Nanopelagicales bacterium]
MRELGGSSGDQQLGHELVQHAVAPEAVLLLSAVGDGCDAGHPQRRDLARRELDGLKCQPRCPSRNRVRAAARQALLGLLAKRARSDQIDEPIHPEQPEVEALTRAVTHDELHADHRDPRP